MACFWFLISNLLLLSSSYQTVKFGHALELPPVVPELPELGLDSILDTLPVGPIPEKRYIVSRSPQVEDTTSNEDNSDQGPANNGSTVGPGDSSANNDATSSGSDASGDPANGSDSSSSQQDSGNNQTSPDSQYSERGEQPVTNYTPSVAPIENDSDWPAYDGQVVNSTTGGPYQTQYQYHIIVDAEANADVITLTDEYANYTVTSMLQCVGLCNDWNQKHASTVVCQAVSYYGNGECYPLEGLSKDSAGRYAYYAQGSILGLVLRTPSYPTPSEPSPARDGDSDATSSTSTSTDTNGTYTSDIPATTTATDTLADGGDGGDYTTTTSTSGVYYPSQASRYIYSSRTIDPTDAYGKTTLELYVSSCPTHY